ncbi:centriole, cilia and spindle-associated protein [Pholidichthys leucotaenia]
MVAKKIRSEYMKKFKDPKWETYSKCYEEMLKYRLTRRLLEHSHNPWFWSGSDSDSDSGGRSPTSNKNQVLAETSRCGAEAELEEHEGARMKREQEQQTTTTGPVPRLPLKDGDEEHGVQGSQCDGVRETRILQEREEQRASSKRLTVPVTDQEKDPGGPRPLRSKPSKSSKHIWRSQWVRPGLSRPPKEDIKESRHPFALYGSGEKDADIAARKTHNVGPTASTNEIHESALRAKTRREVERRFQTQRTEHRRAKFVDVNKARKIVQPDFNPWLTEYMRCFSARSR